MAIKTDAPSYEKSVDYKNNNESDNDSVQYLEKIDSSSGNAVINWDDSIEQTRVGKKTWLIAIVVSMGGFLFGEHKQLSSSLANADWQQVTTRVSLVPCSLLSEPILVAH